MSEPEKTSGLSTGAWIAIGVIGVIVAGGCLVSCVGLIGMGFVMPAVRVQQQTMEAEAARHEAEAAKQEAGSARQKAPEAEDRANAEAADEKVPFDTTQPELERAPAKEKPEGDENGGEGDAQE